MTVGAYYFGGWAGQNALAGNDQEPWARNAPTHLTRRMFEEFPEREPVWGWRDDSPETMERQIDLAADSGLPGIAIAGCGAGTLEMGYTHRTHYNVAPGYVAGSEPHKYAELMEANRQAWGGSREQPCIPIVTAGWDKRPWEGPTGLKQKAGWYYPDRTPEQFAGFLRDAGNWMDTHPDQTTAERIALIYAWNEFGEGGYIAPTKGDPDGKYLQALRSAVAKPETNSAGRTAAAIVGNVKTGKILFLGNSITRHGSLPAIGWTNNWGMAASAEEKDYVHVLARSIAAITGTTPVTMIENIADFERQYDTYDPGTRLQKAFEFKTDTIIVAIGENVPSLASEESKTRFRESLLKLLEALKDAGDPTIIVRSSFWPDDAKDKILKQACAAVGGVFVDISSLSKDESNYARSERDYAHSGVAAVFREWAAKSDKTPY